MKWFKSKKEPLTCFEKVFGRADHKYVMQELYHQSLVHSKKIQELADKINYLEEKLESLEKKLAHPMYVT